VAPGGKRKAGDEPGPLKTWWKDPCWLAFPKIEEGRRRNLSGSRRLFTDEEPFPSTGNFMKKGTLKPEWF
jgi:hypothetical protein